MHAPANADESRIAGTLAAGGPLLHVAGVWIDADRGLPALATVAGAMVLAGFLVDRRPLAGRLLATAALLSWLLLTAVPLLSSPAAALVAWLAALWILSALWVVPGLPGRRGAAPLDSTAGARLAGLRASLRIAAILVLAVALADPETRPTAEAAMVGGLAVTLIWAARTRRSRREGRLLLWVLAGLPPLAAVVVLGGRTAADLANVVLMLAILSASLVMRERGARTTAARWWEHLFDHPARQLVMTFLSLILLGALLLKLPLAAAGAAPVAFLEAAFTAVSAVCVTGLIVLDTPVDWSIWGQGVILVLIQLGGLGIMTFATALLGAVGQRLPLRQEGAYAEIASGENRRELYTAVGTVLRVTFVAELLGAAILLPRFLAAGDPPDLAAWRAAFTAISAFCNAGFALQSDSLIGYAHDPLILHTVGLLIVLGGISPAVVVAVRRRRRPTSLQVRLVLWTSGALLVVGALLFAASEWNNALAALGPWDKLHSAWFQSVTMRTAGFNSVDFSAIRPATVTLCVLWMFIGGSPGGTAGGIKTTTIAVLLLAVAAAVKGQRTVTVFGRTIPHETVYRAASMATIGGVSLVLFLLAIQLTQTIATVPGLFEVASALGTVGLSMGATGELDAVGRIIIMVAMFAGRVGPLTLIVFLMARNPRAPLRVPEEGVPVG